MKLNPTFGSSKFRHSGERTITARGVLLAAISCFAYPNECITQSQVVDVANRDENRLVGEVTKYIGRKAVYPDMLEGGTMPNDSEIVRTAVAEQAVPAASMVRPVFIPAIQACGTGGGTDQVGTTEFQFQLKNLRGRGPKICIKTTRTAWKSSYPAHINSLKQLLTRLTNADARANFLDNGGCKFVADSTGSFAQDFAGDINAIGTLFPNRTPDSPLSFRSLEYIRSHMQETLGVMAFEDSQLGDGVFKVVVGQDAAQGFRDELGIKEDVRALTTGRYKMGQDTIQGYTFSGPYHGIAIGTDPEPLRFSAIGDGVTGYDSNGQVDNVNGYVVPLGQPVLIEPSIAVQVTTGWAARPNPYWVAATGEIGFLFGQNSFKRLVPEKYSVEGWDFSAQITNGGLKFVQLKDADCNLWGDFGQHLYEIERAYQPIMPHAVAALAYKRCRGAMNLVACGA